MTPSEVERLVRGFVSQPGVWVRPFYLPSVRPANPWPRDCRLDTVRVGRVRSPRYPSAFARVCPRCRWRGPGLPGDACPSCGLAASDGVPDHTACRCGIMRGMYVHAVQREAAQSLPVFP